MAARHLNILSMELNNLLVELVERLREEYTVAGAGQGDLRMEIELRGRVDGNIKLGIGFSANIYGTIGAYASNAELALIEFFRREGFTQRHGYLEIPKLLPAPAILDSENAWDED